MKVSDVMSPHVDFVSSDATIHEVSRLIFGAGINGLPVVKDKKIIGFVTERDILSKFYPTIEEYLEDPLHTSDFEEMERKVPEILSIRVEKIMSKDPITVTANTPLLRAQSLMFVHKVGRLPVVDKNGALIGIISKGDIFKAVVGKSLPYWEEEEFYDWIADYHDILIDWKKRLSAEIPDLVRIFKDHKVKKVLDIGSGGGEHVISLAEEGFKVHGLDVSKGMYNLSEDKKQKLKSSVAERITFFKGSYKEITDTLPSDFDAALFMGNALPHVAMTDKDILKDVAKLLNKKSVIVMQLINFKKRFKNTSGLRDFIQTDADKPTSKKHAFVSFYSCRKDESIISVGTTFDFDGNKWTFRNIQSTPVVYFEPDEIVKLLKKFGFSDISLYGSSFYGPITASSFDPQQHDLFNVVAKR